MWNSSTTYVLGDTITYLNIEYECLIEHSGILPTNELYWIKVWKSGTEYNIGDKVKYIDDEYILIDNASIGTFPTNTSYWRQLDSLIITGNEETEYDLEEILKNKDRMSSSALIIPEESSSTETGEMMLKDKALQTLVEQEIEWVNPFIKQKR